MWGGAAIYRANVHIAVASLLNAVAPRTRSAMLVAVELCMAMMSLFMLFYGIQLCQITWNQSMAEFPGLPVGLVYSPIPVAGLMTFLFLIERVWVGHPSKDSVMYSDEAVELE